MVIRVHGQHAMTPAVSLAPLELQSLASYALRGRRAPWNRSTPWPRPLLLRLLLPVPPGHCLTQSSYPAVQYSCCVL